MDASVRSAVVVVFVTLLQPVNRFDVLEFNRTHDEAGRVTLTQWIAWDWDHESGVHRCQWWQRDRGEMPRRTSDGWSLTTETGRRIEARSYRETWTDHDPEVADRAVFPTDRRRRVR